MNFCQYNVAVHGMLLNVGQQVVEPSESQSSALATEVR